MVVLKDKLDMSGVISTLLPGAHLCGSMERMPLNADVSVLSVQFSGVGLSSLRALPNLRWVLYRSSAVKADLDQLAQRGISVVACHPCVENVARFVVKQITEHGMSSPYAIIGDGHIGRYLKMLYGSHAAMFGRMRAEELSNVLRYFETVICAASYDRSNYRYLDRTSLSEFRGSVISVSDKRFIDDADMVKMLRSRQVRCLVADMLEVSAYPKDVLLCVNHTGHSAWMYNLDMREYWTIIKRHVDAILNGSPIGVISEAQPTWDAIS